MKQSTAENSKEHQLLHLVFGALLLALSSSADAQQPKKIARIGLLSPYSSAIASRNREAFLKSLHEFGYAGNSIVVLGRYADGNSARLSILASELVSLKPDVIMTSTVPAIQAAMQATSTIPIVTVSADPVGAGLVASLARPGGNVTGLSLLSPELDGKRLEVLSETFPKSKRVAFIWNPADAGMALRFKAVQSAGQALHLMIQSLEVKRLNDLEGALESATVRKVDAMIVPSAIANAYRRQILDFTLNKRLPAMYENRESAEAGGLIAYGPSGTDLWRRAATYVDKILKGAKPGDLPVEQPRKFELVINLHTANQIGVMIPQKVLARADKVIR